MAALPLRCEGHVVGLLRNWVGTLEDLVEDHKAIDEKARAATGDDHPPEVKQEAERREDKKSGKDTGAGSSKDRKKAKAVKEKRVERKKRKRAPEEKKEEKPIPVKETEEEASEVEELPPAEGDEKEDDEEYDQSEEPAPPSEAVIRRKEEERINKERYRKEFEAANPPSLGLSKLPVRGSAGVHFQRQAEAHRGSERPPEPDGPPPRYEDYVEEEREPLQRRPQGGREKGDKRRERDKNRAREWRAKTPYQRQWHQKPRQK